MVKEILWTHRFEEKLKKIKDKKLKRHIKKEIEKIIENPTVGKPLRFSRKGERTIRVGSFRLIYTVKKETLVLLDFDHRKRVYRTNK